MRIFKIYMIFLGIFFSFSLSVANAEDLLEGIPWLGIETWAQKYKPCVFAIHYEGRVIGTGFLVKSNQGNPVGITCDHIIEAATQKVAPLDLGLDTQNEGYKLYPYIILYRDKVNDIAVIEPQFPPSGATVLNNAVIWQQVISKDNSYLIEGRGVITIGYPLSLGIEENRNFPIVRTGIVAQFAGKNTFLIDGVASHGNSGSPVIGLKAGAARLIGMITSFQSDKIDLYDENKSLIALIPYNSGLAQAITGKTIAETLNKINK